jgi:hypothetical protein
MMHYSRRYSKKITSTYSNRKEVQMKVFNLYLFTVLLATPSSIIAGNTDIEVRESIKGSNINASIPMLARLRGFGG